MPDFWTMLWIIAVGILVYGVGVACFGKGR